MKESRKTVQAKARAFDILINRIKHKGWHIFAELCMDGEYGRAFVPYKDDKRTADESKTILKWKRVLIEKFSR